MLLWLAKAELKSGGKIVLTAALQRRVLNMQNLLLVIKISFCLLGLATHVHGSILEAELYAESKSLLSVHNLINLVLYGNVAILKSKLPGMPQEQIFWHCFVFQFIHR